MRIEPKQAFYNDATGAVQPWKDIEVTDSVGNALVSEGLAIAIAEGGGGGGDFTTAKVTITPSEGASFVGNGACSMSDASIPPVSGVDCSSGSIYVEEETTLDIILYKGSAYVSMASPVSSSLVTVTGGIEAVPHFQPSKVGGFFVTGDGTITITEE